MTKQDVKAEVNDMRQMWGMGIATDPQMVTDDICGYVFQPDSPYGYRQQYRLSDGKERHCGIRGGFWTAWR